MYFLKDTHCSICGGDILVIPAHIKENGKSKIVVDGGTCQGCLRNIVLPDDEYHDFVRRHCYVRKDSALRKLF
ncbi:MAG: hypothetical protein AB1330_01470 [Bacillota bacterium]